MVPTFLFLAADGGVVNTNMDLFDTGHPVEFTMAGVHDSVGAAHGLVVSPTEALVRTLAPGLAEADRFAHTTKVAAHP